MVTKLAKIWSRLGFVSSTANSAQKSRIAGVAICAVSACLLALVQAHAQTTVTRTANDGFGASGFNTAAGWSDGNIPAAGSNYLVQNFDIRTPSAADADFTFAGDSMTISDGGRFLYKGNNIHIITINNLILDGGYIRNTTNAGNGFTLAGNLHLTTNGGIIWPANGGQSTTISANIDGIGPIAIGGADGGATNNGQNNT